MSDAQLLPCPFCGGEAVIERKGDRRFLALCKTLDVSPEWLMDGTPLDFHSTAKAPQGRHAKYWIREAVGELQEIGILPIAKSEAE